MNKKALILSFLLGSSFIFNTTKPVLREAVAAVLVFKCIISPLFNLEGQRCEHTCALEKLRTIAHNNELLLEELLELLEGIETRQAYLNTIYYYSNN